MADLIRKEDTLNEGREKLNEAIKDSNMAKEDSSEALDKADTALANSESTQTQLDTIVIEGDSSVEAAQARVDEKGQSHTTLKKRIDDGFTKVTSQLADNMKLNSGNKMDIFNPPPQQDIHSYFEGGDAFDFGLFGEYYELFERLFIENEGYIEQEVLGRDSSGGRDFVVYKFAPERYEKTIIIGAGMHGGEKVGIISLYNFLKLLCEEWQHHPQLAYIKKHVRLVVIPLQNPTGVNFNNRLNSNGVDLNRNFDYKWDEYEENRDGMSKGESVGSEIETQYITQILNENSDAIAYIDIHNMSAGDREYAEVAYGPNSLKFPIRYFRDVTAEVSGKRVELVKVDYPTGYNYAISKHDMIGICPEYVPGEVGEGYKSVDMTYALKWYSNIIIRFCLIPSRDWNAGESDVTHMPNAIVKSWFPSNYDSAIKIPEGDYGDVDSGVVSEPEFDGYVKINYELTIFGNNAEDNEALNWFTPVAYQEFSTSEFKPIGKGSTLDDYRRRFEVYNESLRRNVIHVSALIPIRKEEGRLFYFLKAYTTGVECRIMRMKRISEMVPTDLSVDYYRG